MGTERKGAQSRVGAVDLGLGGTGVVVGGEPAGGIEGVGGVEEGGVVVESVDAAEVGVNLTGNLRGGGGWWNGEAVGAGSRSNIVTWRDSLAVKKDTVAFDLAPRNPW